MYKLMKIVFIYTFIVHSCLSDNLNFPKVSPEDSLLDNIIVDCNKKPNLNCISKNTFHYLEKKFNSTDDWEVTESLNFKKNERVIETVKDDLKTSRKSRKLEDITDLLYEKGVRYLRSHDLTLNLPQLFFEGTLVKISAPENANSRALFQVELVEPEGEEEKESSEDTQLEGQEGRFFIKKLFGKHIRKKLLLGFFALLLVIKLIKIKLFFLLPLILGVGTVKKLAIKFLFFIFPALATLFKSCHHHHHHVPVKQYHVHTVQHSAPQETYYEEPAVSHYSPDWQRRNNEISGADPTASLSSWGPYYNAADDSRFTSSAATEATLFSASFTSENLAKQKAAQQQAYRFQQQQAAALKIKNQQTGIDIPSLQLPVKVGQLSPSYPSSNNDNNYNQDQLTAATIPATSSTYDSFYSPIVTKLDAVFMQLGFDDEPCRERLVCSMYKTPTRFSPHSNLVSAELSRDPEQLQRPTSASAPVRRFFKYVQAAKDGQDQQDCLRLYPACTINTDP